MKYWTLDDIPWDKFDPSKIDPEVVPIVKAASMVEYNSAEYATYLCSVFRDDPDFKKAAEDWAEEERQHGEVLREWAKLADPDFDFDSAFRSFFDTIKLPTEADASVRGSRSGEMIARCVVEIGTSSYYSALMDGTEEPVLREICRRVAADELRHYKLFYQTLQRYLDIEDIGFWRRLWVAAGRVTESEDDELAYAYYAANDNSGSYDRKRCANLYFKKAFSYYKPEHVERGMAMMFKAIGLKPHSTLNRFVNKLAWAGIRWRTQRLAKVA